MDGSGDGFGVSLFLHVCRYLRVGTGQTDVGFQVGDVESAASGFLLLVLAIVVVIVIHEVIHVWVLKYYGGDVSFGVGLAQFVQPYAYVTTTRNLTRTQFVVVALAPLVLSTLAGIPLMIAFDSPVLIVPLAVNAGGAVGDFLMVGILRRYPPHVVVEDSNTGLRIYGSRGDEPVAPATSRSLPRRIALGSAVGIGLLTFGAIVLVLVLALFDIPSVTLGVPDTIWTVFAFESGSDGFATNVNVAGVVVLSLLLGVGDAVTSAFRKPF